ncbi:MAG TPA: cell division protein FtsA [Candidatus Dormibacteraeota bacterium]|nr:cell division protein FtsA [Candidatus Dormibacteraeota bacterium]
MAARPIEETFIGLDIGTTKVCCIVGLLEEGSALPSIIGIGQAPTAGLRKGVVIDVEETVSSITAAVDEAERISGIEIDRATIGIDGSHIESLNSTGVIAVGHEINEDDIQRVQEAASAVHLPPNREILQVFPRSYSVDSQLNIKDPIGINGVRLEADVHIITGGTPALKNLHRCIYQAGIDIEGQVLIPVAAASAVLSKKQREIGAAIIDIGGGTTGIAVYEEGEVLYTNILPLGAGHITNDLAIGLRTSIDIAEKIKLGYVKARHAKSSSTEKIRIEELDGDEAVVSRRELDRITGARLEEIMHMVKDDLKKISRSGMLPGGVVITGGGAKMPGIDDLAKEILELPASIGRPEQISGISDKIHDPSFAAPVGLMLENMHYSAGGDRTNVRLGQTVDKIKKTLRNLLP